MFTKKAKESLRRLAIQGSRKEARINKAFAEVFDTPTGALQRFLNSPEFKAVLNAD